MRTRDEGGVRDLRWDGLVGPSRGTSHQTLEFEGAYPDHMARPEPAGFSRLAVLHRPRPAVQIDPERLPLDHLQVDVTPTHEPVVECHVASLIATDERERLVQHPYAALARAGAPESDLKRPRDPTGVQE